MEKTTDVSPCQIGNHPFLYPMLINVDTQKDGHWYSSISGIHVIHVSKSPPKRCRALCLKRSLPSRVHGESFGFTVRKIHIRSGGEIENARVLSAAHRSPHTGSVAIKLRGICPSNMYEDRNEIEQTTCEEKLTSISLKMFERFSSRNWPLASGQRQSLEEFVNLWKWGWHYPYSNLFKPWQISWPIAIRSCSPTVPTPSLHVTWVWTPGPIQW
jgi:hypothetical protein